MKLPRVYHGWNKVILPCYYMLHPIIEKSKEQELDDHHDENDDDAIFHPTLSY
jgi:hypothetical protein